MRNSEKIIFFLHSYEFLLTKHCTTSENSTKDPENKGGKKNMKEIIRFVFFFLRLLLLLLLLLLHLYTSIHHFSFHHSLLFAHLFSTAITLQISLHPILPSLSSFPFLIPFEMQTSSAPPTPTTTTPTTTVTMTML